MSLNTVNFYMGGELLDVLPSTRFVSAWRSAGAADEWVTVDLGFESEFDKLVFHWLNPAASGEILTSHDNIVWTSVARIGSAADFGEVKLAKAARARYVRAAFAARYSFPFHPVHLRDILQVVQGIGPDPEPVMFPDTRGHRRRLLSAGCSYREAERYCGKVQQGL